MSKKGKIALVVWTGFVLAGTIILLWGLLHTRVYSNGKDDEVRFTARNGWILQVKTEESIPFEAADNEYFRLVQDEKNLFGTPQKPPVGYPDADYFYLDSEISQGKWDIKGGSTMFIMTSSTPFTAILWPTVSEVWWAILTITIATGFVWGMGVALGAVIGG